MSDQDGDGNDGIVPNISKERTRPFAPIASFIDLYVNP